jgi:hypothetical protein
VSYEITGLAFMLALLNLRLLRLTFSISHRFRPGYNRAVVRSRHGGFAMFETDGYLVRQPGRHNTLQFVVVGLTLVTLSCSSHRLALTQIPAKSRTDNLSPSRDLIYPRHAQPEAQHVNPGEQPDRSDQSERSDSGHEAADWFFQQRSYPLGFIPAGARLNALRQLDQIEEEHKVKPRHLTLKGENSSQWTLIGPHRTNGLASGRVSAIAVDPRDSNIVYLGAASGGVWKTKDGGSTWTPLTDMQPSLGTGSIALDPLNPDTVYVGTGEENDFDPTGAGLFKSVDGGTTWKQYAGPFLGPVGPSADGFGGSARIGSLAVHPTNTQVLLAAVAFSPATKEGIYRSTDGGSTWELMLSGASGTGVVFDPTDGNIAYAALGEFFGVNSQNGVYKSLDAGISWTKLGAGGSNGLPSTEIGRIAIAITPSQPTTLYVAMANSSSQKLLGFYKTVDGGQNWTALTNTPDFCDHQCGWDLIVSVHPSNPNIVFAGGAYTIRLIRSLDGGSTWSTLAGWNPWLLHPDLHALTFSSDGAKLYVGDDGGAWSTTDATNSSVNFTNLNATLAITQFYPGFSIHPTDLNMAIGGTQDEGTIRYAGNFTWDYVACGDGHETAIDPFAPSTVYISCGGIDTQKSTSNGDLGTWQQMQSGIDASDRVNFNAPLVMDPNDSQRLYFGTLRVYQTNDGATSWTAISPDLTGGSPYGVTSAIAVAPSDSNTVYVATTDSRIHVSTNAINGAVNWTDISHGLPNRYITQVIVNPANSMTAYVTFSGYSGFVDNQGHVFTTTNGGLTWSDISGTLPNVPVNDIVVDPDIANTLYIATDVGAFSSSDNGNTWTILGGGLPRVIIMGLRLHRPTRVLRAGTYGRSMWDLQLSSVPSPVSLSATTMVFNSERVGTTSLPKTVTLTNIGGAPITLLSIGVSGDFAQSNTCGARIPRGAVCAISISFTPTALGPAPGQITVSTDAPGQTFTITLSGTGALETCAYSLNPGGQAFRRAGGSGTISVTAGSSCSWAVSGTPGWATISGSSSGMGNGQISYSVSTNSGAARAGTIMVAGDSFVVEQESASTAGLTLASSMAQTASGGGWDTELTLVNMGAAAGEALLNFLGNDGSPLQLPFTFSQVPSPAGSLVASTLDQTLSANSMLVLDSQQPGNPSAKIGSAQLRSNGTVGGFAIFKYTPTGQEAVVPLETRNAPSYVLAFDNTGVLGTGVAIANLATQAANIPVVIRDDTGAQLGTDTIQLAAQGHTSFMLTSNYAVTKKKRGTIELDTPPSGHISSLGLRANGRALTTLPVLANVTAGGGSMAQVASGGGWQTTFTLVNTGTASVQAQLSFFDNNGTALSLPLTFMQSGTPTTASTISQTVAAGATLVILTQGNNAGASVVGSAQLTTTGNVSGFAIFRYNPTGQEAVVPLETRNAAGYVLAFDNTNGLATGVALANVSNQAANVPVVLRDDTGATLGTAPINLVAHGHTSFILTSSYTSVANKRGTVEFDAPAGAQISILGLRATPAGAVTTIPLLVK